MMTSREVKQIVNTLSASVFGTEFTIEVFQDKVYEHGRLYLQVSYNAPCTATGQMNKWKGRKWYLSEYMTEDEVVKTAYAAFEAAVKHEVMEGFKVQGRILFNPHVSYLELLRISDREIKRIELKQ